jgi:hypothetical protein
MRNFVDSIPKSVTTLKFGEEDDGEETDCEDTYPWKSDYSRAWYRIHATCVRGYQNAAKRGCRLVSVCRELHLHARQFDQATTFDPARPNHERVGCMSFSLVEIKTSLCRSVGETKGQYME